MLQVPHVRQDTNYSCGPACASMVLKYWGHDVSEKWLIGRIGATPADGASPSQLAKFFRAARHRIKQTHGMRMSQVRGFLDQGWPVIVAYQAWPFRPSETDLTKTFDNGHYSVVIQADDHMVWLADPSSARPRRSVSRQTFESTWRDIENSGRVIRRWGLAVGPRYTARGGSRASTKG